MTAAHSAAAPLQGPPGTMDADAGADQMDSAQPNASSKRLHEGMNESEAVASGEQNSRSLRGGLPQALRGDSESKLPSTMGGCQPLAGLSEPARF